MFIDNPILNHLISKETYTETLQRLTPQQLAVVALIWHDALTHETIGRLFGITRQAVAARVGNAHRQLDPKRSE